MVAKVKCLKCESEWNSIAGCLENADLENADRRPQTSKTQTSKTQTSKTQTPKTQTSKTQTSKTQISKTQTFENVRSFIKCMGERKFKTARAGDNNVNRYVDPKSRK